MNPITGVCEEENRDVKLQLENFNSCQHLNTPVGISRVKPLTNLAGY